MEPRWYLQSVGYVGMSALRGFRVQLIDASWWLVDTRYANQKPRFGGPFRAAEDAREAAVRRVAA